jgi:hypothetical protein
MQLQFTSEEFQVLADIIEEHDEKLRLELAGTENPEARSVLERDSRILNSIEDQIISREPRFAAEELEMLNDVVAQELGALRKESEPSGPATSPSKRLELLRHIRDRLAETCAMF